MERRAAWLWPAATCIRFHRGNSSISAMRPSCYPFSAHIAVLGVRYGAECGVAVAGGDLQELLLLDAADACGAELV